MVKNMKLALAGVAEWIELWPANHGVPESIPSQGICLGFSLVRSPVRGTREEAKHWCFSPSLSSSLPLCLE